MIDDWQTLHLASKRPSYAIDAVRTLRRVFAHDLDLPATDLDRATIVRAIDAMTRRGRATMAAQTVAYGKAMFSWALKRGTITANPFVKLPVAPAVKRERVLSDDELAAIWRAAEPHELALGEAVLLEELADRLQILGQWDCAARPNGNAVFPPLERILRQICFTATCRDADPEPALFIVENEHVAFARWACQSSNAVVCELHADLQRTPPNFGLWRVLPSYVSMIGVTPLKNNG